MGDGPRPMPNGLGPDPRTSSPPPTAASNVGRAEALCEDGWSLVPSGIPSLPGPAGGATFYGPRTEAPTAKAGSLRIFSPTLSRKPRSRLSTTLRGRGRPSGE